MRYHHLDAVRGFALLLGVVFHAAESFGRKNTYWAVVDCSPSDFLEWFRLACHSFRLELFFVIAGFFARLLLLRRGTAGFVWNRVQRILVPLVAGWMVVYPLLILLWLWGWSLSGKLADAGIPAEVRDLPIWKLWLGFFLSGSFVKHFDLTHLWFLHQLLAVYALMLGLRWLAGRFDAAGSKMARLDRCLATVCSWRGVVVCFGLPSIPLLLLMRNWSVDTPKASLLPYPPTTLLFGFCFLAGWLWHRQPALLDKLGQRWRWHLGLGVFLWVSFGVFAVPRHLWWARLIYMTVYAHMMWAFVLGFLGWFTQMFKTPKPWVRYVADSSYWIYITHLPLIIALQILVGRAALPWPLKYAFINAVAIPLLFLSYHYLVRGTFIGAQLNGRRYPLEWPWRMGR